MVKKRINFAGSSTLILKDKSTLTEVIVTAILKPHTVRLAHPYYCLEIKGIASHRTCFMEKMASILPTGQWYAPSAVIAWYCIVLHSIAWYCMVLHGIAWYCMVLHGIA